MKSGNTGDLSWPDLTCSVQSIYPRSLCFLSFRQLIICLPSQGNPVCNVYSILPFLSLLSFANIKSHLLNREKEKKKKVKWALCLWHAPIPSGCRVRKQITDDGRYLLLQLWRILYITHFNTHIDNKLVIQHRWKIIGNTQKKKNKDVNEIQCYNSLSNSVIKLRVKTFKKNFRLKAWYT